MIEVSIIFGHYSEDPHRDALALKCIKQLQKYRNEKTELIVVTNGFYGNTFEGLCDLQISRSVDLTAGKSSNLAVKVAKGNILFFVCNDIFIRDGAIEECTYIVNTYPKYLATPVYPGILKWHNLPSVDGRIVNTRLGSNCLAMTRQQYEDIGAFDEVRADFDMINYINRWIDKGYAVMGTKERLARDLGIGVHSDNKQRVEHKFKRYHNKRAIYDLKDLRI